MSRIHRLIPLVVLLVGCSSEPTKPKPTPTLAANDTPAHAVSRLIGAYETKSEDAYAGMFTGDFSFEFSTSTDPTLVQQYSTGWFKNDETESSSHLFFGYTPPGGMTLPAAISIDINLALNTPFDDNSPGVDPTTHKVLATRVDGEIVVPQSGSEPLHYIFTNNYNIFYFVRGDSAAGLGSSQPADTSHWYIYRWSDLTQAPYGGSANHAVARSPTWGSVKGEYH